ncbi:retrotransposon protein, putative, ty1-copia subclass [Tanacetum coccineum]
MSYYFYYLLENKIFVARNAEFFENSLMVQEASGIHGLFESSRSDRGVELIQEEDTQPSENTNEVHNEVVPIEVEPQNVEVYIHRSARIPQAPDRYGFYVDVAEYELGDLNEPPNYKVALSDPKFYKWLEAMNMEMQSMKDNQVWVLVDLPPNGQTVRSKWLFNKKTDMDGNIHTFKAHFVAKRYTQTYCVDYGETFSPVADIRAIRILIAIATENHKEILDGNSKKGYTPMIEKRDYRKSQGAKTPSEVQRMQRVPYASAIGSIIEIYWTAVKTILNYLRNTKDMVLVYGAKPEAELKKSTKQSTTAMSSTEVGYITTAEASMEAVWMRKFIDGLRNVMPSNKRQMLCDNEPAIVIANDPGILKGARNFQRKYNYIREVIQEREIVLKKVHTHDNVADPFTKPMSLNKHYEHAMTIGIVPASSLM